MHRTQLQLEDWQYEALRSRATRDGRSLSGVVRDIVTSYLTAEADAGLRKLESIAGLGDGPGDLAANHDEHLYGRRPDDSGSDHAGLDRPSSRS